MTRTGLDGAILALLGGFIVSAGLVGFVLSAGGYQLPTLGLPRPAAVGPVGVAVQAPAVAQAPTSAQAAPAAKAAIDAKIVATDLKFTRRRFRRRSGSRSGSPSRTRASSSMI